MAARERKVEHYLDDEVKKLGSVTYKWTSPGRVSVPDRIVIHNGVTAFVEVKTVDGAVSGAQERMMQELHSHGANAFIIHGEQGVDEFIQWLDGKESTANKDHY